MRKVLQLNVVLVLVGILAAACSTPREVAARNPWYMPANQPVVWLDQLTGLSEAQIERLYGHPEYEYTFCFKEGTNLMEYESHLYDLLKFKTRKERKAGIQVKRLTWRRKQLVRIIWLTKKDATWKVISGMIWDTSKIAM